MDPSEFLRRLQAVRWDVAARTYGSSHSTLIGLIAQWWVDLSPHHTVLDGAPSFSSMALAAQRNAGWCDLMLCAGDAPVAVVEVEGRLPLDKLSTIENYFSSPRPDMQGINIGVLACYAYEPRGRGTAKAYPPALRDDVIARAEEFSSSHPHRAILLVGLDKIVDNRCSTLRQTSTYARGKFSAVKAICLVQGHVLARADLWNA